MSSGIAAINIQKEVLIRWWVVACLFATEGGIYPHPKSEVIADCILSNIYYQVPKRDHGS